VACWSPARGATRGEEDAMAGQQIAVRRLAGALGAELEGLDLTQPLDDPTVKQIQDAWMEHQVLFLRGQKITREQHKSFARRFGDLHIHPVLQQLAGEGHPEIVVLESNEKVPFVADAWHSDVTFERKPPLGSVLRAVVSPEFGGDTMWASMYAAYEALSDSMQRLLSGLRARHAGDFFNYVAKDDAQRNELAKDNGAVHPVIRTHPVTGRKAIFVNSTFTRSIEGMKPAESKALLGFLYEHVSTPDFSVRFHWETDSIAMWDNRCTQHRVLRDRIDAHRRMERVTIVGDAPF
jgi:taurine dioxygenase